MNRLRLRIPSVLIPLVAVLFLALPAQAALKWCKTDPIVRLDGVEYQLIVAVPEENVHQVNGPLHFEVYSPKGSTQELLFTDAGYNGHGETVKMKTHKSKKTHKFFLKVPRTGKDFPVQLQVFENGQLIQTLQGKTGGIWVKVAVQEAGDDGDDDEDDDD